MQDTFRGRIHRHARFNACIREFFSAEGFEEVDTPALSPFLIPEPAIEVFRTELITSGEPVPLWLAPSPELWMKRLLARGSGDIFQVSRSFRNGDFESPVHNPEFSLLEWYRVGAGYLDAIEVTERMFERLLAVLGTETPTRHLSPPFLRMTMEEAFAAHAGITLSACQDVPSLRAAAAARGIPIPTDCTWEQAFHLVFLTLVEPRLPIQQPVVILDYPALIPTTARRRHGTPWAERWELYVGGVEIANCYTEETDRDALRALLQEEEVRKRWCRVPHAIDRGLADVFPPGFPACSGTALGLDRLEMAFNGEKSLQGVIFFPLSDILPRQSVTG
jgi:lysyl-tRNA synthetase class 2